MSRTQKNRLVKLIFSSLSLVIAMSLILWALKNNINLFYTPEQIHLGEAPLNCPIRIGGLVKTGSIKREDLKIWFSVIDASGHAVEVFFKGILPDLFKENQGMVALGSLQSKTYFVASEILAKHDENYMPPEVANSLDKT